MSPQTRASGRPTLRSLAEAAGVSVATVSRALKGDELISRATRDRIAALAAEHGYAPDRAALGLRTGRSHAIAVLISRHDEILGFSSSLISGMTRSFRGTPYQVNVTPMFGDEEDLAPIRQIIGAGAADGVVFSRMRPQDTRAELLMEAGLPFVSHGRSDLPGHAWFDYDNEAFGREAVRMLAEQGRRRIGMIVPPERFTFHRHMTRGVCDAAATHGVDIDWCDGVDLDTPAETLHAFLRDKIGRDPAHCDGFICGGEVSAIAANAAVVDRGFVPQQDVGLVAKQTTDLFGLLRPTIPAIYENIIQAGAIMADMLRRAIEGAPPETLTHLQPIMPLPLVTVGPDTQTAQAPGGADRRKR